MKKCIHLAILILIFISTSIFYFGFDNVINLVTKKDVGVYFLMIIGIFIIVKASDIIFNGIDD